MEEELINGRLTEQDVTKFVVQDEIIDLKKLDDPLEKIKVQLRWEVSEKVDSVDLDVAAVLLDDSKHYHTIADVVYFNSGMPRLLPNGNYEPVGAQHKRWKTKLSPEHPDFNPFDGEFSFLQDAVKKRVSLGRWQLNTLPVSPNAEVIGSYDERGEEVGDCEEQLFVNLSAVDEEYSYIAIIVAVSNDDLKQGVSFADVKNATLNIIDNDSKQIIISYQLNKEFPKAGSICFGYIYYNDNEMCWKYQAKADAFAGGLVSAVNEF